MVIVEQIPSKMIPDVIKNTAVKVMHRLPALDDREAVGGTVNLDPAVPSLWCRSRRGSPRSPSTAWTSP